MAWRSFFAVQQQLFFGQYIKLKFRKLTLRSRLRSQVGYGLIRGRTSAQIKTLRPYFLTLIYQSYQSIRFFLFRGIIQLSKLHYDDLGPGI